MQTKNNSLFDVNLIFTRKINIPLNYSTKAGKQSVEDINNH